MLPLQFRVLVALGALAASLARADQPVGSTPTKATAQAPPLFTAVEPDESGVTMRHPLIADHPRSYLYISGFACGSIAIGDVNGDGRLDLFFTSGPETNRLYLQTDEPLHFRDATDEAGLSGRTATGNVPWSAGAALVDLNHDGQLDIYVCNYDAPNQLFINNGQCHFSEQAADWGLDIVDASLFPAFMDIDGSGELALYLVTNRYERPGGRPQRPPVDFVHGRPRIAPEFQKYYGLKQSGLKSFQVDFVGRPDRLLIVERDEAGHRHYRDVSRVAGIGNSGGHGLAATWFDYDGDSRPDLYVCNDFADPDWLYHNEGPGSDGIVRFKNTIADVVPLTSWSSMGADTADVNNDCLPDLVTGEMASRTHVSAMINTGDPADRLDTMLHSWPRQTMRNMMFVNTGAGRFVETAWLAGIAKTDWTWAVKLADFDNDGRVDLFVTNGVSRNYTDADRPFTTEMYVGHTDWDLLRDQPPRREENLAYRNIDGLRFEDVSRAWGLNHLGMSYAAAYGDLDRDGDLDLVVCNLDETVSIYRNEGVKGHHWLEVQLRGATSRSQGWGASVRIKTESGWRVRALNPATGFLSCNDPILHFGLGEESVIEQLEVRWPSGRIQRLPHPAVDQLLMLSEPSDEAVEGRTPDLAHVVKRVPPSPAHEGSRSPTPPLFSPAENLGLDFRHRETEYDDYAREPLLPGKLSQLGPGIAVGDADADGDDDIYFGGAAGQAGALFVHGNDGRFTRTAGPWEADAACEDMGVLWFDADGDGRLDLYVVSGGVEGFEGDAVFQDRLYLNVTSPAGPLRFAATPHDVLPDSRQNASAVCAADFDCDGDLDLFVGSRSIPGRYPQTPRSLLLRNDSAQGKPKFVDVTDELAPGLATAGLVTSGLWTDTDADGYPDLLVTCEWGPVKLFHNRRGSLDDETQSAGLAERKGWWNGIAPGDFDADGRIDYLVTNVGLNTKYGTPSHKQPALAWAGDVQEYGGYQFIEAKLLPGRLLPVRARSAMTTAMPLLGRKFPTYRAYATATLPQMFGVDTLRKCLRLDANEFRSGLLLNRSTSGRMAFEWQPLPDLAQTAPGYGIAIADYSGDGRTDAVVAQNLFTREPETGLWRGGLGQFLQNKWRPISSTATLNSDWDKTSKMSASLEPVPAADSGIVVTGDAKGAASLDFDGDSRPDLLIAQNDDEIVALRNESTGQWLSLRLLDPTGMPAIGARVTTHFADGRTVAAELSAGSGYLSQSAAEIFLGQGGSVPRRAEIHWPSGTVQNVDLAGKNGRITVENARGSGSLRARGAP